MGRRVLAGPARRSELQAEDAPALRDLLPSESKRELISFFVFLLLFVFFFLFVLLPLRRALRIALKDFSLPQLTAPRCFITHLATQQYTIT